ncbi:MAG: FlgD immunoglobulin-like domain containing protein [Candidatus Eisenbacteria bacterium]|nr:FlgD immunoglobulin-like domain containing protein [Candidatus Eisenbacteria bacterium]
MLTGIVPAQAALTIGPGPARGTDRAGVTWYEDFQDWSRADLKALDGAGLADARYNFGDGRDDSRDLVAFYFRDEGGNLYFRVDLYDLALGAENGSLDIYVAIDAAAGGQMFLPDFLDVTTDRPWELCVNLYSVGTTYGTNYRIYNSSFTNITSGYLGSYFNSQLDAVEFGIARQTLVDAGWNGSSPLTFQVVTAKDGSDTGCSGGGASSDLTDAFEDDDRGCSDGVLNGGTSSTASAGYAWYASIAHGNQSVNKGGDIGAHIYDPAASTGISGGTGFLRTLDTHEIFRVPLNIHPSGTLTIACNWAARPGGAADPQDGPAFLARVKDFVDADQSSRPGSLIGGVLAEHIMPYFEGPVNAASMALTDELNQAVYGVSAAAARVMHTPERVIRSQSTGLSPLDGHTFEDIAASPYQATYLDEVTHLHWWFYAGETCQPDQGYRHKVHRINGVYSFVINDREDQGKFGNHDGGMVMDSRFSLLEKALFGNSSEVVTVFDDWEALAGKSFDPGSGAPVPNNNPNQYHNTIRWAANHPWIRVANLDDILTEALANPGAFVIDHGTRFDLPMQTYEWLKHASEDSYNYWYYNNNAGFGGNEQDFYNLVPVLTGPQGDYRPRGVTPAADGPPLPSGRKHGDLNTPGSLMFEAWATLEAAPAGRLKELGVAGYLAMIYETAWHEEDELNYSDTSCYGNWVDPDDTWDGVNTWCLRLNNHVRWSVMYSAAAGWVEQCRTGSQIAATEAGSLDIDLDGEAEYVLKNNRIWCAFERYGGRCVLAVAYDPMVMDGQVLIGAPFTNPSAPGEEEYAGIAANRCSAFKEMNGGSYVDAPYSVSVGPGSLTFTSPDGLVVKTMTAEAGSNSLRAHYTESVPGPLYFRIGLSPNPLDLAFHGQAHLTSSLTATRYMLVNSAGGGVAIDRLGLDFNATPSDAGYNRRNLALTEEVELSGAASGDFTVTLHLLPGVTSVSGTPETNPIAGPGTATPPLALATLSAMPASGPLHLEITRRHSIGALTIDVITPTGQRIRTMELGERPVGIETLRIDPVDDAGRPLPAGTYFIRALASSGASAVSRWVVLK